MTSAMLALILTSWAFPVPGKAADFVLGKYVATFMAVTNGNYDNVKQIETEVGHDFVQATVFPVTVPAMPDTAFQYGEWVCNGNLLMLNLYELTEDKEGIVYLAVCLFTNISEHRPGTYNTDDLAKLRAEDIQCNRDCLGAFVYEGNGAFVGTWPDCNDEFNGHHLDYWEEQKCQYFTMVVPLVSQEESSLIPYNLSLRGEKYPLIGAPDDFVSPCGQSGNVAVNHGH